MKSFKAFICLGFSKTSCIQAFVHLFLIESSIIQLNHTILCALLSFVMSDAASTQSIHGGIFISIIMRSYLFFVANITASCQLLACSTVLNQRFQIVFTIIFLRCSSSSTTSNLSSFSIYINKKILAKCNIYLFNSKIFFKKTLKNRYK